MAAASQERLLTDLATQHAADAAKSKATELKEWITKGPLALKVLAFGANLAALIVVTLNLFGSTFSLKWITASNDIYVIIGCLIGVMLEVKPCVCTRHGQRRIAFWCRVLSRVQGRGVMYVLLGLMVLARADITSSTGFGASTGRRDLFFSGFWAKRKIQIHRSSWGMSTLRPCRGVQPLRHGWKRLSQLLELAMVAAILVLRSTKNELVAVFDLLDRDHSGDVSFEEFSKWWLGDKEVDYSLMKTDRLPPTIKHHGTLFTPSSRVSLMMLMLSPAAPRSAPGGASRIMSPCVGFARSPLSRSARHTSIASCVSRSFP